MPTPDQVGSPFRAAGALPVDRRYGGRINALDQLPIHALGDQYIVDGNGTVTSLPSMPIGERVFFKVTGTPTFTNSTRLVCPSGVNYVAAVGDVILAVSDGDGIWRLYVHPAAAFLTASISTADALSIHGADIASAATLNLDAATGNYVHVTGTTTVTAITLTDGRQRTVYFTGVLTLTNGASLVLPGGVNITTAAGDIAVFVADGTTIRCVNYVQGTSTQFWSTGDAKITFKIVADTGWILCDDGSIGDGSSSATTRANADTSALFTLLYNNITALVVQDNTGSTVSRGASAAADFAAHRRIVIPKTLGRAIAIAGAGSGLTSRPIGSTAGSETETPTIAKTASHDHNIFSGNLYSQYTTGGTGVAPDAAGALSGYKTGLTGSGAALNIVQPEFFLNIMIKL